MKILFIIGNGFDINLGMKTRYLDFLENYKSIDTESELLNKLKNTISTKLKDWSDLELALGQYTEHLNSLDEVDEVVNDIGEKLSNYLLIEEKKIDYDKVNGKKLYDYLMYPENTLPKADINNINDFKEKWNNHHWYINIITLNYTRVLENLLQDDIENITLKIRENKAQITLQGIEHLHGYAKHRMIMGVNDKSQIINPSFHDNQDILETLIKSECNKAQKHTIDDLCLQQINEANLICIFGSSIGETDNMWWEIIGERLKKDCQAIIFTKCEDIDPRISYVKARKERALKRLFLTRTKLSEEDKKSIEDKIYVGVNTKMFEGIIDS